MSKPDFFAHVDFRDLARWHREGAETERALGRAASYHARMAQARQCEREAEKRESAR